MRRVVASNLMHYVYILQLVNKNYYIGETGSLSNRLRQHVAGEERTTKRLLPCKLVLYLAFESKQRALKFERYLKTGSGFAFRNKHLV